MKLELEPLTIGELARRSGVNLETVRYYERRRLLPKPARSRSGYRQFPPDFVRRIRFIKHAQALGFTLKEINELLGLRVEPGRTCQMVRSRAEAKIADITDKIRSLRSMKKALEQLSAKCSGRGPISECPILQTLDETDGWG
jgi:MerR family mercuric resistance operon transcriptional regulator